MVHLPRYLLIRRIIQDISVPLISILSIYLLGAWSLHLIEGWSFLDALYFVLVTLTTIGYGDFIPTQPITRVITMGIIILGIGIISLY